MRRFHSFGDNSKQLTLKAEVAGSNPVGATRIFAGHPIKTDGLFAFLEALFSPCGDNGQGDNQAVFLSGSSLLASGFEESRLPMGSAALSSFSGSACAYRFMVRVADE